MQLLKNFEGLYGDQQHPFADGFIHHELLEVRSRLYDWDIDEHLHTDLVQVFLFRSGSGVLFSERRRLELISPCVVLIPANTLHGFSFPANMVGEVFTIREQMLDMLFKSLPHILLALNRFKLFRFLPDDPGVSTLHQLKEQLCDELTHDRAEKNTCLQLLLQQFWLCLYRMSLELDMPLPKSDNRTLAYFQAFQKAVRLSVNEVRSVQDYAAGLNITTVHLNRICQALVRKSALQVIHGFVIDEARKYLTHTTYSLSEISYFLNFKDPAYFSRLFKKETGMSPGAYRKQIKK
ncbi:AraC family transcriptional regulator [Arsenicibacter rosenii]|uniref:AraC family transcriptional regulator n=1 Tax=Arsenicibacter rosenii TaxID=1750698 RepID=A0A1S2VQC0_9BACT|nr:AraC family transcriptional regulator [Arsenicibacter rosenii]